MTGITCALAGSGGVVYTGSATVTTGYYSAPSGTDYYGCFVPGLIGDISPRTWAGTGLLVNRLVWSSDPSLPPGSDNVQFSVAGLAPNTGWTTMTVGGVPFTRASASYSQDGTSTNWLWFTASNPFGGAGATRAIIWS